VGFKGRVSLLKALAKMATESLTVQRRLRDHHANDAVQQYWRFDEDVAISEIRMDDYRQMPRISGFTLNYLNDEKTKSMIEKCADAIIDARNSRRVVEQPGTS